MMIEEVAVEMARPGTDHASLVVHLAKRAMRLDTLFLHVPGVEPENVSLLESIQTIARPCDIACSKLPNQSVLLPIDGDRR